MVVTVEGTVLRVAEFGEGDKRVYVAYVFDGERSVGEVVCRNNGVAPGERYLGRCRVAVGKYGLRFYEVERGV